MKPKQNTKNTNNAKTHKTKESFLQKKINSLKEYWLKKEEQIKKSKLKQFEFFILGFLLFYLTTNFILSFIPSYFFQALTGNAVRLLLSLQGIQTQIIPAEEYTLSIAGTTKPIIISTLCAGVLEIIILCGAIFASFGVSWEKKKIGIILAIITGYLFNLLRVWITINIILMQNIQTAELAHDILFRITLFTYIVAFYVIWFYWAMKTTK